MSRFTLGKDDKEGSLYDLFAVANHSGTVNFGHYTAFSRLAEADQPIDGLKKEGLGMYFSLRLNCLHLFCSDVFFIGSHMITRALWNMYTCKSEPERSRGKHDFFPSSVVRKKPCD